METLRGSIAGVAASLRPPGNRVRVGRVPHFTASANGPDGRAERALQLEHEEDNA